MMQSPLGDSRGASWPHFERSCQRFLGKAAGRWAQLGSGGQTVVQKGEPVVGGERCWMCITTPSQGGAGSVWFSDVDFPSVFRCQSQKSGRRLLRASHLGPLLPEGEIALTFQGCWLNPGSESFQGKHLFRGGVWGF